MFKVLLIGRQGYEARSGQVVGSTLVLVTVQRNTWEENKPGSYGVICVSGPTCSTMKFVSVVFIGMAVVWL